MGYNISHYNMTIINDNQSIDIFRHLLPPVVVMATNDFPIWSDGWSRVDDGLIFNSI